MRTLFRLVAFSLALMGTAQAQQWEQVVVYEPFEGYLGDQLEEFSEYDNFEIYDERSARFYTLFPLDLAAQRVFVVEAFSNDFQPALSIQDMNHEVLLRSTFLTGAATAGYRFGARLEFHNDDAQFAELLITSHDIAQGRYEVVWSLWRDASVTPAPPAGEPAIGSGDCNCYDDASGRWYDMAFDAVCDPAKAIKWCN